MLFPTLSFAVFFLVIFSLAWILNRRRTAWKVTVLAASYFFYGLFDWKLIIFLAGSSAFNHLVVRNVWHGKSRGTGRWWLAVGVVANLSALCWYKYYNFVVQSLSGLFSAIDLKVSLPMYDIVLPVGISFITFQAISLCVDAYRESFDTKPCLLDTAVFMAFFPKLVVGPIQRGAELFPQIIHASKKEEVDVGRAATLIIVGLFKKMVIADALARVLVNPVFEEPEFYAGLANWLAVYGYAIQIYCDFSAYSDVAIGVALLMGVRFSDNFNAPYLATSLQGFWRRWHISLSTWLRDYLYIPMGGSRAGSGRTLRNVMITFFLGGLWHGAAWRFVVWGCIHGSGLCLERVLPQRGPKRESEPRRILRALAGWLVTFHVVCLAWVFFRADSFGDAGYVLKGMFSTGGDELPLPPSVFLLLALGFACQLADGNRLRLFWAFFNRLHWALQAVLAAFLITAVLAFGPSGVAPFIYFRF